MPLELPDVVALVSGGRKQFPTEATNPSGLA
jgi:hypothetical protein